MRLTKYGIREILIAFLLLGSMAGILLYAGRVWCVYLGPLALAPAIVFVWVLSFFRDPEREIPGAPGLVVSPADGVVTHIDEVDQPAFIEGKALRVSIFMSIFNVHVNRAPCDGRVVYLQYRKGEFLNAMIADSAHRNEANLMGLETGYGRMPKILVRQVAGLIARRIVCDCREGDEFTRGQRFGMIKFSSRVEVFMPVATMIDLRVKVGQKVCAGSTIIGELK